MEESTLKNLLLTLSLVLFAPLLACAQESGKTFVEGENYDLITPPLVALPELPVWKNESTVRSAWISK